MAESIYWIDADGGALNLTDGTIYNVLQGVDGRFMPPFEIIADEVYGVPGDYVRLRKTKPREVVLPIMVMGTSETDLRTNMRMLTDAFDPVKGDGKLKVITPDSKTLLLNCHYLDGMTAPESVDTGTCTFRKFIATFLAHEPFWYNALENERLWQGTYLDYIHNVTNSGDVDAWPLWELGGSAATVTAATIKNLTTGKSLTLTLSTDHLHASDHAYIDTRPSHISVTKNHITTIFARLSSTSVLFPLVPGVNSISLSVTGNDGDTTIRCRWVDRYYGV